MKIFYHNHDEQGVPQKDELSAFGVDNSVEIVSDCNFAAGYTHYVIHDPTIQREVISEGKIWAIDASCVLIFISSQGVDLGGVLKKTTSNHNAYYIYGIARQLNPRILITKDEWKDIILTRTAKYLSGANNAI